MTLFYLIITFWGMNVGYGSDAVGYTSQTIPHYYATRESCDAAGADAKAHFNGGGTVNWVCVGVDE